MQPEYYFLISGFLILSVTAFIFLGRKPQSERFIPHTSYELALAIIDETIKEAIQNRNDEFQFKEARVVYDFKVDLTEITKDVMMSFNVEFLRDLQYYHTERYIINYVNKKVQRYLFEFIRANNPNLK